jgi:4-hydroxy-3-methylbut-2-enyl diphosphate reductase
MKSFEIPVYYKSNLIQRIKKLREEKDPRKKDYSPTELDFGPVIFYLGRHFGFCYGVENAIEISYKALEENPGKRIFLLSEMIHNPGVNADLISRGIKFIMETSGEQIIKWSEMRPDDLIIIPAFGTTVEIQNEINKIGINTLEYDTTCPFVEKVWNKAATLGKSDYTIVVHGKYKHEETRATFSHSKENAPTVIIRDEEEAKLLCEIICGIRSENEFFTLFEEKHSEGFNPSKHLSKIGVVNQTTMLATETQSIAECLKKAMIIKYGEENIKKHFADTRDTLCYATHDNQSATYALLGRHADLAIVVGGYNSSNTSHIFELCEEKLNTYFISSSEKILSKHLILHYDFHNHKEIETENFLPVKEVVKVILTSGASCPDAIVESVMQKILSFYEGTKSIDEVLNSSV